MTKYTKYQYKKDIAANDAAAIKVKELLAVFDRMVDNCEKITNEISDAWNATYDRGWELQQEREDIERRFRRRNWTWQDHSEYELVSQNID